jgi:hypothetical protein
MELSACPGFRFTQSGLRTLVDPTLSPPNLGESKCAFDIVVEKLALRAGVQ